jgi:hypothetical protein
MNVTPYHVILIELLDEYYNPELIPEILRNKHEGFNKDLIPLDTFEDNLRIAYEEIIVESQKIFPKCISIKDITAHKLENRIKGEFIDVLDLKFLKAIVNSKW